MKYSVLLMSFCFLCKYLSVKMYCLLQVTSLFWLLKRGGKSPPDSRQSRIKDSDGGCEAPTTLLKAHFKIFIREGLVHVQTCYLFYCELSLVDLWCFANWESVCLVEDSLYSWWTTSNTCTKQWKDKVLHKRLETSLEVKSVPSELPSPVQNF